MNTHDSYAAASLWMANYGPHNTQLSNSILKLLNETPSTKTDFSKKGWGEEDITWSPYAGIIRIR